MKILLVNDDGWNADGLAQLRTETVAVFPEADLATVAPADHQSMCSHSLSPADRTLRSVSTGPGSWKVWGTPADCIRVALFGLDLEPDLVISGINHGGNLGQDIYVSGTIGAAREAAYHGVRSVALSHYLRNEVPLDWDRAGELTRRCLTDLLQRLEDDSEPGVWNYNLPHPDPGTSLAGVEMMDGFPEPDPIPVEYQQSEGEGGITKHHQQGVYADRPRSAGSDVAICFGGNISRTWVPI